MALTKVSTDGVKDDAITKSKIPANQIEASELADNAVDTNAIADQAVSLSKLSHGTSSNDGKFLRANNGADPSFETVSIPSGTTINNNADNRFITGSGSANTLNGESNFQFASNRLLYGGAASNLETSFVLKGNSNSFVTNPARIFLQAGQNMGGGASIGIIDFGCTGDKVGAMIIGRAHQDYSSSNESTNFEFWTTNPSSLTMSKKVQIGADGNLDIVDGNLILASGHGISFASTSNSSGTTGSELFDDYEEGTWTPTINVGTYSSFLTNRYIKIGRLVHLHGGLIFNNNTSSTRVEISNIPFTTQSSQYVGNVWLRRTSTGERNWNMILGEAGQNVLGIFRDSNGNDMGGHLSYSDFQHSSTYFNYSITYIAAS